MYKVIWALAIDTYYLVVAAMGFISLVTLVGIKTLGLEVIMIALSGLLLVGVNDYNLGI